MNVFYQALQFFSKLDIPSRIFYVILILVIATTMVQSFYNIIIFNRNQIVESKMTVSLPRYSGSCTDVVEAGDRVFIDSKVWEESTLTTVAQDKIHFKQIYLKLVSVFQLAQFCEDTEAQGRILYIGASIEIGGGFRGSKPLKQVVRLATSYFNEAQHFGYNDRHPNEAYWLKSRILRNAYRAGVEITTTKNNELLIKGS